MSSVFNRLKRPEQLYFLTLLQRKNTFFHRMRYCNHGQTKLPSWLKQDECLALSNYEDSFYPTVKQSHQKNDASPIKYKSKVNITQKLELSLLKLE